MKSICFFQPFDAKKMLATAQKMFLAGMATSLVCACSVKSYNPNNPKDYNDYWCSPNNRENSVPAFLTKKAPDKKYDNSQQDCMDGYQDRAQGNSH